MQKNLPRAQVTTKISPLASRDGAGSVEMTLKFALFLFTLSLFGAGCFSLPKTQRYQTPTSTQPLPKGAIIIYVQNGCPHCAAVENNIRTGQVNKKIQVAFKEVSTDMDNARELISRAQNCKIAETNIGVPFLWDGEKCYVGQDKILDYIAQRMKEAGTLQ